MCITSSVENFPDNYLSGISTTAWPRQPTFSAHGLLTFLDHSAILFHFEKSDLMKVLMNDWCPIQLNWTTNSRYNGDSITNTIAYLV